jgi:dihydrofolate reductase
MHSSTEFSPARNWIAVVAIARNGVIGNQGGLPWRLSSDLKRFKQLTMGHCLLMGRKTYESIGRPLPGRQTIVLSRSGFRAPVPNVACVASAEDVSALVEPGRKVMVVGGAQIYQATLPFCSEIWLTRVLADVAGDAGNRRPAKQSLAASRINGQRSFRSIAEPTARTRTARLLTSHIYAAKRDYEFPNC